MTRTIKRKSSLYVRELSTKYKALKTPVIKLDSPQTVADFLKDKIGNECKENFVVLGVNNKNEVVIFSKISTGTVSESIVHPREVFVAAILGNCSGSIISHNHPSGTLTPSRQDIATTKRLKEAGEIMGIPVIDHIIIGFNSDNYYSFKEEGGI